MKAVGLDIGTTSVCGILHDAATGEILVSRTEKNDANVRTRDEWAKEQDPRRLTDILRQIVSGLDKKNTASIGVTGQMHGIVYLDKNGLPVGNLRTWQDGRGNLPYRDNLTYAAYLSEVTGYPLATGYGAVTFFYDTVNGLVPKNAVTFSTIHDLAVMVLTGRKTPLLHPSDAASIGLYDPVSCQFDKKAAEKAGLDFSFFPAVDGGFAIAGESCGVPVAAAIGDNQASFLGSVADMENSVLVNVGTGAQVSCLVHAFARGPLDCRPLLPGQFILAGSTLCGGRAYAVLERFLRETAELVTGVHVESAYPAMDRLMEGIHDFPDPLRVTTTFSGTRKAPEERGKIENVGTDNLTAAALCDGVLWGMVDELYGLFDEMAPLLDGTKTRLIGSGNGIRFNAPLQKRFEARFGLKMEVPEHREEAAFGASLFALTASGVFPDMQAAQKLIRYE